HVGFSRRGVEVILLPLWASLAVLFLVRGLKSGKYWQFALSGFFWGSAIYTYQAAWLLPGVLALFLAYKTIQERGFWRRHGTRLLLLMAVALLVALPLAVFALQNPAVFGQRASQTNVAALAGDAG
ncbi:MAG: glycosyltransferase family 39 protein, partial [Anaerolineae bacterium]|nr:glycosyltransferase family 39 protein [Anaerolineae bacterium]